MFSQVRGSGGTRTVPGPSPGSRRTCRSGSPAVVEPTVVEVTVVEVTGTLGSGAGSPRDSTPRRLRSRRPSSQEAASTQTTPKPIAGSTGLKTSELSSFSAAMARTVGPPQGTMFITPAPRQTTPDSTRGFIPSLL
ncbi:hypothetical protein QFZ49_005796 [Streptomyces turgidiscabies]|uniref:Uncharacterized protein n=1 Tax=Streptomyces turgidiscabies TaxID=85558 RepID=A0ABU0RV07_9ACTN|nr:hypothetical protein [Streptomyces turgidiscabies]